MTEPVAGNPGEPTYGTPRPPQTYGSPVSPPPAAAGDNVYGSPANGVYGSPAPSTYGTPAPQTYGTPAANTYGTPAVNTYGTPAGTTYGAPAAAAYENQAYGQQSYENQAYGDPGYGTPYGNPVSTPPAAYGNPVSGGALEPYPGAAAAPVPYSAAYPQPVYPAVPDAQLVTPGARLGAVLLDALLGLVTLWIGWFIWALITWKDGQTPGKKILGHVVVDANTGQTFDWGRMALREFVVKGLLGGLLNVVTLDIYFLVDAFMVFGNRNQTLHDKMSTSVVRYL